MCSPRVTLIAKKGVSQVKSAIGKKNKHEPREMHSWGGEALSAPLLRKEDSGKRTSCLLLFVSALYHLSSLQTLGGHNQCDKVIVKSSFRSEMLTFNCQVHQTEWESEQGLLYPNSLIPLRTPIQSCQPSLPNMVPNWTPHHSPSQT